MEKGKRKALFHLAYYMGSSRKQFLEVALTYPAGVDKKKISSGLVMVGK